MIGGVTRHMLFHPSVVPHNFAGAAHFIVHLLPCLYDYDVKMSNFTLYGGRKQAVTKKFSLSFWTWIWCLGIQLQESTPTFNKVSELE